MGNPMNGNSGNAQIDYEQTAAYFHALHDVRFKLLALLPILSGAALFLIPEETSKVDEQVLPIAILGVVITIGLTLYDQRNTRIYDRLVTRAQFLEKELGFSELKGDSRKNFGPFHSRPPLGKIEIGGWKILTPIWHDFAIAMIYAASLASWVFLGAFSGAAGFGIATVAAAVVFALTCWRLVRVARGNYEENKAIKDAN